MIPFVVLVIMFSSASYVASPIGPEIARARRVISYWNKPIVIVGRGRTPMLHPTARFAVSAKTVPRPNVHPRGETVHELSLLVINAHVTQDVNRAIIGCCANGTSTSSAQWGLFNVEQFASERVQVEYFVSVKRGLVEKWKMDVNQLVRSGGLTRCVRKKMDGFEGAVIYGKKAQVSRAVMKGVMGEQAWVIWLIVAILTVVIVEVIVILWLRARRKRIRAGLLRGPPSVRRMEEGESIAGYDSILVGAERNQAS